MPDIMENLKCWEKKTTKNKNNNHIKANVQKLVQFLQLIQMFKEYGLTCSINYVK